MKLNVRVARSISDCDKEKWNSLSSNVFTSFEWFKTIEQTDNISFDPYYIVVHCNKEPIAFAAVYKQTDELIATASKTLLGPYSDMISIGFNPCILCYSPLSVTGGGMEIDPAWREYEPAIIRAVSNEMRNIAVKENVAYYGFQNISNRKSTIQNELLRNGYVPAFTCYGTYLDIAAAVFDDYFRLLTKNSRKAKKREILRHDRSGLKTTIATNAHFDEIMPLLRRTFEKYNGLRDYKLNASFFSLLNENIGKNLLIFCDKRDDELISVCIYINYKDCLYCFKIGTNEKADERTFSGLVTQIYEPIRYAISNGCKKIDFGTSSYKHKIVRGARPVPLYIYLNATSKRRKRWLGAALPILGGLKMRKHQSQIAGSREM